MLSLQSCALFHCARHPMPPGTVDLPVVQGCSVSVLAGSVEGTNQLGRADHLPPDSDEEMTHDNHGC